MTAEQQKIYDAARLGIKGLPADKIVGKQVSCLTTLCDTIDAEAKRANDAEDRATAAEAKLAAVTAGQA